MFFITEFQHKGMHNSHSS